MRDTDQRLGQISQSLKRIYISISFSLSFSLKFSIITLTTHIFKKYPEDIHIRMLCILWMTSRHLLDIRAVRDVALAT